MGGNKPGGVLSGVHGPGSAPGRYRTAGRHPADRAGEPLLRLPARGGGVAAQGRRENRKRVLRLMREDNLLALRKRRFVSTTDSAHHLWVYPNVAGKLQLEGINQLWVADITYVRLQEEFVYLAVVLDAYSRRVVGWHLGEHLDVQLTLQALNRALEERSIEPGIVHHSDRGLQYCWQAYVERL